MNDSKTIRLHDPATIFGDKKGSILDRSAASQATNNKTTTKQGQRKLAC